MLKDDIPLMNVIFFMAQIENDDIIYRGILLQIEIKEDLNEFIYICGRNDTLYGNNVRRCNGFFIKKEY